MRAENLHKILLGPQRIFDVALNLAESFTAQPQAPAIEHSQRLRLGGKQIIQRSMLHPGEDCIVPSGAAETQQDKLAHTSINRRRRILTAVGMQKAKVTALVSLSRLVEIEFTVTATKLRIWCDPLRAA